MRIALIGLAGSGKGTVSSYLTNKGYSEFSFAGPLKDALASIFYWDRSLLEGDTPESRKWRETTDSWWSQKLNIPDFTPRKAMQLIGTNVMRKHFDNGIWIHSLEKRLIYSGDDLIISDCRFPNEINLAKNQNCVLIRIKRGVEPIWYNDALRINKYEDGEDLKNIIPAHSSEWRWIGTDFDHIIENDGDIDSLYAKIDSIILKYEGIYGN